VLRQIRMQLLLLRQGQKLNINQIYKKKIKKYLIVKKNNKNKINIIKYNYE